MTTSSRSDGRVTIEQRGHVLLIGIDRVGQQNRIDPAIYSALATAITSSNTMRMCAAEFSSAMEMTLALDWM